MAERGARTIPKAVRELCLAFPGAEEFESHGSPNYRAREGARKAKVFAVFALNHHGDGHVALWLNTPALEQSRLLAESKHLFKPPYVGPSGWIGIELNKGVSWKRVCELVYMAYANSSPPRLVARIAKPPAVAAPGVKMKPADIDRMLAPKAQKAWALLRAICKSLPETEEGTQMGSVAWRTGKRSFLTLHDYGKGLCASFWVGIDRQGPLEMDPRFKIPAYSGANGWIAFDMAHGTNKLELRELVVESFRHFATRRAIAALEATSFVRG
ncbi:MAG: MmcQ/YjbR family DNA-binding protein [Pseudomonadota bacterium]